MNKGKTSRPIKGLGLCSGGLDSILSALLLQRQGIDVTWVCFETPFFSADSAKKASQQTHIPLIVIDLTIEYMKMMRHPRAGFGKNMNPCMDCHALMFAKAGELLKKEGFDFLFSGEVLGQRPKSQNKNSLRYVEKNSGFDGHILRPLCAKRLPQTPMEKDGLVDREQLMDITGRSRKVQMQMTKDFGVKEFPSPAGGCLLTDKIFSARLKDLMDHHEHIETRHLYFLKFGRHFRLDSTTKVIVGRSKNDNKNLSDHIDKTHDILIKHADLPGPDVILTGNFSLKNIQKAAEICSAYTKSNPGDQSLVKVRSRDEESILSIQTPVTKDLKPLMI
ncbi:MAG: tRNA 4-thiouridine(8) synthase ThiI [Desulfobacula sp.]|nr:tRNA 4-thiouridine(8) synthase ThiI [Desulfobacula sp.]